MHFSSCSCVMHILSFIFRATDWDRNLLARVICVGTHLQIKEINKKKKMTQHIFLSAICFIRQSYFPLLPHVNIFFPFPLVSQVSLSCHRPPLPQQHTHSNPCFLWSAIRRWVPSSLPSLPLLFLTHALSACISLLPQLSSHIRFPGPKKQN